MGEKVTVGNGIAISWSGGKDSALMLHALRKESGTEIGPLVTTVTREYDRVSMHGVRRSILAAQASSLGLPLVEAVISASASNPEYETAFMEALDRARRVGGGELRTIAFGDLYLRDVREYREKLLSGSGWTPHFPLWLQSTHDLARQFVDDGFRAIVCCVDTEQLAPEFAGREYDHDFINSLPPAVDPCGEKGEFHTCVYAGPIFQTPLHVEVGEKVRREGRFEYCEVRIIE